MSARSVRSVGNVVCRLREPGDPRLGVDPPVALAAGQDLVARADGRAQPGGELGGVGRRKVGDRGDAPLGEPGRAAPADAPQLADPAGGP